MSGDNDLPEVEFFTLPSLEDVEYWERNFAAGLHQPIGYGQQSTNGSEREDSWRRVDLLADELRAPPQPPEIHGLLYTGKRHVISGPPESAKTLVAYLLLLEALRTDHGVAIIDMEMGPHAAVTMLRELGATDHEIGQILYFEPEKQPYPELAAHLHLHAVSFVLIDAGAGAYGIAGLDDNKRQEVEQFANTWIRPLQALGISTIVLEHVVKNADNRGGWIIGSERKLGQADVHLGLGAVVSLARGTTGIYKVVVHKDRSGYLKRGHLLDIHLASDPDTHQIDWEIREAEHHSPDDDNFRPTALMEKVSMWLEQEGGWHSGRKITEAKLGKNEYVRKAIKVLAREGFVAQKETGRGYEYSHTQPFRRADDRAPDDPSIHADSDRAPTAPHRAPGAVSTTAPRAPLPLGRGAVEGAVENDDLAPPKIDVTDPAIQALLDDE